MNTIVRNGEKPPTVPARLRGGYDGGQGAGSFGGASAKGGSSFWIASGALINNSPGGNSGSHGKVTITIAAPRPATANVRVGTPPNPSVLMPGSSRPVAGSSWSPFIDHSTFMTSALVDGLIIALGPTNTSLPPFGTLLCDLSTPFAIVTRAPPGTPFNLTIPRGCGRIGLSLCVQGFSADTTSVQLTNALDVDISTF